MTDLPALAVDRLPAHAADGPPPRFLLLYGSARPGSFSHLLAEEVARLLRHLGGETRLFDPATLPPPGSPPGDAATAELHAAALWSDAQFWCSPENYGTVSAVLKHQLDSCPPVVEGRPLFGGKPLATAQVCGAGPSFNTTMALAAIGRWLGMFVTPSLVCVPQVQTQFEGGRLKASPFYDQLVDLAEELFKVTVALRAGRGALLDRYSKRA
ncbi:MAG: NAD(P)H-dependent oxidoreductase [Sphingomonas adhaesiva]|uniref:NADPH-dependent FMN reductase n=1 Tax=Sphingomonas adhaesiva TaxID=28212 RepID=UPI002FF7F597